MEKVVLPFMGTHVANLALNRQIGLVVLLSGPQRTCGLTSISHESWLNDQLQVAGWMIQDFLDFPREDGEDFPQPWIKVPEWKVKVNESPDKAEKAQFEGVLRQITAEAQAFGAELWNPKNEEARVFLLRLVSQINECVLYTNRRLEAIKVCLRLCDLGENPNLTDFQEELLTVGPRLAQEIVDVCAMGMGMLGVSAVGYCGIKNSFSALSLFATDLHVFICGLLTEEAIRRGYTRPV
ncbi:MAG: hypothetical protein NTU97_01675 [Candidatus Magasanikbacteria bacterium]|nr:hypothetical protein [Candidatus Magasanikbacteria bacterium]